MKTKILVFTMLLSVGLTMAAEKNETFKVYGNCGMCEDRIENAAKEVKGVKTADWNKKDKMITLSFDDTQTDMHKIHMAIAKAGHDTEMHKADDDVYAKLHGCCQYERAKNEKSGGYNHGEGHSGCTKPQSTKKSGGCCGK